MLIVDDSAMSRKVFSELFSERFETLLAENGSEATKILMKYGNAISLVLLDLLMPDSDGFDVLKKMHEIRDLADIPVIVATSCTDRDSELRAISLGAIDVLHKDVDHRILARKVEGILRFLEGRDRALRTDTAHLEELKEMMNDSKCGIGLFVVDKKITAVHINDRFFELYGYMPIEAQKLCTDLFWSVVTEDSFRVRAAFEKGKGTFSIEYRIVKKDGTIGWLRMQAIRLSSMLGSLPIYQCFFMDVTSFYAAPSDRFDFTPTFDSLTGIYDRYSFFEAVRKRIALSKEQDCFFILRINISRFKVINDLFGSDVADEILKRLASKICEISLATSDFCRLQADNFAICIKKSDDEIVGFIESVLNSLKSLHPTISTRVELGVYKIDDPTLPVEVMCDRAGLAVYSLHGNYFKRWAFYEESMRHTVVEEQEIVSDMTAALDHGEFFFVLQPIFSSVSRRIVSAEALVRWKHPTKGLIPPAKFIPLFEQNGFIMRLDSYIWEQVCKFISYIKKSFVTNISISVNVSRVDLFDADLCHHLKALTEKYDIEPKYLALEITESSYTDNPDQLRVVITELKKEGFTVMMDDFGSGYSSLNMLKELPVDVLKIDSKFLSDFESSGRAGKILTSVVHMANWLNMTVIAEGVETQSQFDFMRSIGCGNIQGYYFSPPVSVEEFEKLIRSEDFTGKELPDGEYSDHDIDILFDANSSGFFSKIIGGIGIYELSGSSLEVMRVNDGYYEMFGYDVSQFSDQLRSVFENIAPEDKTPIINACHKAITTRNVEKVRLRRRHQNGSYMWVLVNIRFLGRHGKNSIFYFAISDISKEKHLQHELYLERYGKNKDISFNELFVVNLSDGSFERVYTGQNRLILPENGYYLPDLTEFMLQNCVEAQDDKLFSQFVDLQLLREYKTTGNANSELGIRLKEFDDEYHWCCIKLIATDDDDICLIGVYHLPGMQLSSEQLALEQPASLSREKLQQVFDNLPVGVAVYEVGEKLRSIYVNDMLCSLYGYTSEQYWNEIGDDAWCVVEDESLKKIQQTVSYYVGAGRVLELPAKMKTRNGELQWVRITGWVVRDDTGAMLAYTVHSNITAQVLSEEHTHNQAEYFNLLLDTTNYLLFDYSVESDMMTFSTPNESGVRKKHYVPDYMTTINNSPAIHPDSRNYLRENLLHSISSGENGEFEYVARYSNNEYRNYKATFITIKDSNGNAFRLIGLVDDITEQKNTEYQLAEESEFRNILASRSLLIFESDFSLHRIKILYKSPSVKVFDDSIKDLDISSFKDFVHPDDWHKVELCMSYEHLYGEFKRGRHEFICRYRVKHDDDWVLYESVSYLFFSRTSNSLRNITYIHIVNDLFRESRELKKRAEFDALTGLMNRATAEEKIKAMLKNGEHAFMLIDIDDFKYVNDNFGHMAGDKLLEKISGLLYASFRRYDIVGRFGGDEFIVMLRHLTDEEKIKEKFGRLLISLRQLTEYNDEYGDGMIITVSAGVCLSGGKCDSFSTLYSCADKALYRAKNLGKGCIEFATAKDQADV